MQSFIRTTLKSLTCHSSFIFQTSQVYDVNANTVDNDKELFHPSKLTLTEALALESGGMQLLLKS